MTEAIHLDGALTEPAWEKAAPIGPLRQWEPGDGAPASEDTDLRIVYDADTLYVGVVCHQKRVAIVATQLLRDADLGADDSIFIVLDPFFDHRNGFFFQVNPAGARADGQISNNAEEWNRDWDGIWRAAARIVPGGWTAEIAVPFKTLRFKPGQSVWGLNVERRIKHANEIDRWSGARHDVWVSNLSEAGRLENLAGMRQGAGIDIRPYGSGGTENGTGQLQGGIDVFKNVTSNLNASVTVNTDFAETETDARQVNLTRFPLFFQRSAPFSWRARGSSISLAPATTTT